MDIVTASLAASTQRGRWKPSRKQKRPVVVQLPRGAVPSPKLYMLGSEIRPVSGVGKSGMTMSVIQEMSCTVSRSK